jgi:hypothetical protein
MKRTIVLCALLAACGGDASKRPSTEDGIASDSAALDAVTHPSQSPPSRSSTVETVNRRLEKADQDAAARANEAAEQVREAEGGTSTP